MSEFEKSNEFDEEISEQDQEIRDKFHPGFISGWEEDTEGIEEEVSPHETPDKEILWAAENGNVDIVKKLLQSDKTLSTVHDQDGYTPLHRACYNNHLDVVNVLLENGADMYLDTKDKWTPLHSACHWNSAECAAQLVSCGVDINKRTSGGITPLHLAAGNNSGKSSMEMLLLHPDIDVTALNDSHETAYEIARRSGRFAYLFEVAEDCFNKI